MVIDGIRKNLNQVNKKDTQLEKPPKYKLGHVPPKSDFMQEQVCVNLKQMCKYPNSPITFKIQLLCSHFLNTKINLKVTKYDNENMDALCRGEDILPISKRSKLFCYTSSKKHPYFTIQPIKV